MIKGVYMCGDSGVNEDIKGILITHTNRAARQQQVFMGIDMASGPDMCVQHFYTPSMNDIDLADSYVPFEPPQSPGADSINTETMLGNTCKYLLIAGFIAAVVLLGNIVANGNAIPSMQGVNYAHQGK